MNIKIEEAYNDCFERMLSGESLESCLNRYPQHAGELHSMLRTSFDIKRRAYPIQPRPEFKHWARIRMQNSMYYGTQDKARSKTPSFSLRRNLAMTMAGLLVFIIASSGTVAASSDAMPDEPLYGVKLAVEQARITLAPSNTAKAEVYAHLAETRAGEIAAMAVKRKDDKVIATTEAMNYQLQQMEENIRKFLEEEKIAQAGAKEDFSTATAPAPAVPPAATSATDATDAAGAVAPQAISNNATKKSPLPTFNVYDRDASAGGQSWQTTKRMDRINKAKEAINSSTSKSITILQNALDKASDSVKPSLNSMINKTRVTNNRIQFDTRFDKDQLDRDTRNNNSDTNNDTNDNTSTETNINIKRITSTDANKTVSNPVIQPNIKRNTTVNTVNPVNPRTGN